MPQISHHYKTIKIACFLWILYWTLRPQKGILSQNKYKHKCSLYSLSFLLLPLEWLLFSSTVAPDLPEIAIEVNNSFYTHMIIRNRVGFNKPALAATMHNRRDFKVQNDAISGIALNKCIYTARSVLYFRK